MNINELEQLTGVTKQNIRFYEKKELLHPQRNSANNYREYTQDDLTVLKTIKLLRKLDFTLEDIRKILSQEESFHTLLEQHLKKLQKRKQELNSCIDVCKDLLHTQSELLDVDETLNKMDKSEQNGGKFMSIVQDYKNYVIAENKRSFSFKPDTMVKNPAEFTEALCNYANENNLNLVITKESMYPTFEIDGLEYTAHRAFDRFGATVHCTLTHPEDAGIEEVTGKKKWIYRILHGPYLFLALLLLFMAIDRHSILWASLVALTVFPYLVWMFLKTK